MSEEDRGCGIGFGFGVNWIWWIIIIVVIIILIVPGLFDGISGCSSNKGHCKGLN